MKIRILLFGILALVGGYSVAQTGVSLTLVNDSVIVINGETIRRNKQKIFEIKQYATEYLIVNSCKRTVGLKGVVQLFNGDALVEDFGENTKSLDAGITFNIPLDSTICLQWDSQRFKICLRAESIKSELVLVNDSTIELNGKELQSEKGVFIYTDSIKTEVLGMRLSEKLNESKAVLVAEVINDSFAVLKTGYGRKLLRDEKTFIIQPNKNLVIIWGDKQWRISGQTMPLDDNANWIKECAYVWFCLLCLLVVLALLFFCLLLFYQKIVRFFPKSFKKALQEIIAYKQNDAENYVIQKVSSNYSYENIGSIEDLISRIKNDGKDEIVRQVALHFELDETASIEDLIRLIENKNEQNFISRINDVATKNELGQDNTSIEMLLEKAIVHTMKDTLMQISQEMGVDVGTSVEDLILKLKVQLQAQTQERVPERVEVQCQVEKVDINPGATTRKKERLLEDIIKYPKPEESVLLKDYIREWLRGRWKTIPINKNVDELLNEQLSWMGDPLMKKPQRTEIEIERDIVKNITRRIEVVDEESKEWVALKGLMAAAQKSKNSDELANALFLHLNKIGDAFKTLSSEKKNAEDGLINKEMTLINVIKKEWKSLFDKDLDIGRSQEALSVFCAQVKEMVKEKSTQIKELEKQITGKDNEIGQKEKQVVEIGRMLLEKEDKLSELYEEYAGFITLIFEQIEASLRQSNMEENDSSSLIVKKIHERIINNDSWGLNDFILELKNIASMNLDKNQTKEEVKKLFLRCLKFSSWIDILAQIYLYVQEPTVAKKLSDADLDCSAVNKAFILTELIMGQVGIKLQYPRLFSDTFNGAIYDEDNLTEIQDLIGNVSGLVGDRNGLVIDMLRVGYSIDGIEQKPLVARFN